jgi:hypothetical protein
MSSIRNYVRRKMQFQVVQSKDLWSGKSMQSNIDMKALLKWFQTPVADKNNNDRKKTTRSD